MSEGLRNVRKFAKIWEVTGIDLVRESCLLLSLRLGLYHCLVAACKHVCYAVTYEVGNHNLGRSVTKSQGNGVEFHSALRIVTAECFIGEQVTEVCKLASGCVRFSI